MVRPAPTRFNPELLARNPERMSVAFPVSQCKRLVALLADHAGEFNAELEIKRAGRQLLATGEFETVLTLECQRCLQPFKVQVKTDFEFVLVADEAAAEATDEHVDPVVLADDGSIHVVDLFEDELILQVPTVPKHESVEACEFVVPVDLDGSHDNPRNGLSEDATTAGQGNNKDGTAVGGGNRAARDAFAVLKNLKFDND